MPEKIHHLAIIMDGNRRWATERGLPKLLGHTEGAKTLKTIAKTVQKRGIPYLTLWALSTENLQERSEEELKHLFSLFKQLVDYLGDFIENNVRLNLIGNLQELPSDVWKKLNNVAEKTKSHTGMVLTLAINYGGRDEILRAIKRWVDEKSSPPARGREAERSEAGEVGALTESKFEKYLDTAGLPDPDLIIRTGGHQRLSGYLPWQSTYSELYFTKTYWPAFSEEELDKAIEWFQEQKRNRGK